MAKQRHIMALCNTWNRATDPSIARTGWAHRRCEQIARAADRRMTPAEYRELSNGARVPFNFGREA